MGKVDERVLYRAARIINRMPPGLQALLGGGTVVRDGQVLDPGIGLLVRLNPDVSVERGKSVDAYRVAQRKGARIAAGKPLPVGDVRSIEVRGAEGMLKARHYVPQARAGAQPPPLLLFFHGGGFVFGDVDTHDAPCRYLCRYANVHVVSVEYRLAPEHPFPAAPLDVRVAVAWAFENAAALGADPTRIGVAGDSAGGNLSAAASWMAARDGGPTPTCQVLIYPAVDRRVEWPSLSLFADGFFLTREQIGWFDNAYTGLRADTVSDPRRNPLAAEDLSGLPPTLVVTAGFDPLRDEGEAYGAALAKAGVPVTVRRFHDLVHGFINMVGINDASRDAMIEVAGATRMLFGSSHA